MASFQGEYYLRHLADLWKDFEPRVATTRSYRAIKTIALVVASRRFIIISLFLLVSMCVFTAVILTLTAEPQYTSSAAVQANMVVALRDIYTCVALLLTGMMVVIGFLMRASLDREGSTLRWFWRKMRPLFLKEYDPFEEPHGDCPLVPWAKRK